MNYTRKLLNLKGKKPEEAIEELTKMLILVQEESERAITKLEQDLKKVGGNP